MKRTLLMMALLAIALVAYGDDGGRRFTVVMSGGQEAPGPGDPDGTGLAVLRFNPGQEQLCFQILVSDITLPAAAAHVHIAPPGAPGPVVIPVTPPDASGNSSGCVSAERELIKAIIQDPGSYYINVHTSDFPPGAVRGQLSK